jgi:hypothetical protein
MKRNLENHAEVSPPKKHKVPLAMACWMTFLSQAYLRCWGERVLHRLLADRVI